MDAQVEISKEAKFQAKDLKTMRDWANENDRFEDSFLTSLEEQFKARGYLTEKQHLALLNIMEKWRVE